MSIGKKLLCMFRAKTSEPYQWDHLTVTIPVLKHLPGRLTEEDIVNRAQQRELPSRRRMAEEF
jgi:hypothetical protein